jgi:hypothetical protein
MTSILCFSSENQVFILRNETLDLYVSKIVNLQNRIELPRMHEFYLKFNSCILGNKFTQNHQQTLLIFD